jgi:hypothetical protein
MQARQTGTSSNRIEEIYPTFSLDPPFRNKSDCSGRINTKRFSIQFHHIHHMRCGTRQITQARILANPPREARCPRCPHCPHYPHLSTLFAGRRGGKKKGENLMEKTQCQCLLARDRGMFTGILLDDTWIEQLVDYVVT